MTLGGLCNRNAVFTTRASSAAEAAQIMREQHVGGLVVVEPNAGRRVPVGFVTDRGLVVEILAKGVDANAVTVGDVMGTDPVAAHEADGDLRHRAAHARQGRAPGSGGMPSGHWSVLSPWTIFSTCWPKNSRRWHA